MFDRFAILEAFAVLSWDYGMYGVWDRIEKMGFRPRPSLSLDTLSEDSRAIYDTNVARAMRTGSWDRKVAR